MNDRESNLAASILLVTYNRVNMLRRCVSAVLANTQGVEYELIVWDNASTDGSSEYLDEVASANPRVRVVHSPENIGLNGVAASVRLARGNYLLEMDDDVIDVPSGWLAEMIRSFEAMPRAGYLAANVVQNDLTDGAKLAPENYTVVDFGNGVLIEFGPLGGWCSITSARVIADVGNFLEMPGRIFFGEDNDFVERCVIAGYRVGIVSSVRVFHAAGAIANKEFGCIDVCKLKYSDDPGYAPFLRHTLEVEGNTSVRCPDALGAAISDDSVTHIPGTSGQASLATRWTPPLDELGMSRALDLADISRSPFVAELRLKKQFSSGDYTGARRLLWQARSLNPSTVRRCAMLILGFASPRMLAARWRRLSQQQD